MALRTLDLAVISRAPCSPPSVKTEIFPRLRHYKCQLYPPVPTTSIARRSSPLHFTLIATSIALRTMSSAGTQTFFADAVLFDMDGTLTDSIAAVEAAWSKVAKDIGQDPASVIAATHGKRAIDNLSQFKPSIEVHEMDDEVQAFEESILFFADAYVKHGPGSRRNSRIATPVDSSVTTPTLSRGGSEASSIMSSRSSSSAGEAIASRPAFLQRVSTILEVGQALRESAIEGGMFDTEEGKERMIASIPDGRYAVATSGAKTYAYGCMTRVGITPPPVTITADDKRLKAGKPAPDPFLLAAECLGFDAKNCVVFEDSPSGIKAGVASGATVVAVCTSHEREKIESCGAHYLVENMDQVRCEPVDVDGQLKLRFIVLE
ncbi:HAD-like domain-containing protein [Fomitopsis serialis]|uniref:HAD-like domain-containing protein n=1 Tax=Fomitopsis serialis TaxID=139415 RepID=UPI0020076546|nr:HAD-like domain-containing protein [Neoantrodia serialis]KAH9922668.1 HAD-like domain-containing protein [Neoantrodia serialis]